MEIEPSIAKIRNKLCPIVNYFEMRKLMDSGKIEEEKKKPLQALIDREYNIIQTSSMSKLLALVRDDSIW
jgi:hypothetical protein